MPIQYLGPLPVDVLFVPLGCDIPPDSKGKVPNHVKVGNGEHVFRCSACGGVWLVSGAENQEFQLTGDCPRRACGALSFGSGQRIEGAAPRAALDPKPPVGVTRRGKLHPVAQVTWEDWWA